METVTVRRSPESKAVCEVLIEEGIFDKISFHLERLLSKPPSSISIITDSNVRSAYGHRLKTRLSKVALTNIASFPAGEKSKTIDTASKLASELSEMGVDRDGVIVALGGGVVGDLAGFVASIYKRGIAYFQVPTTLLAQVDSSIGGKTGVDTSWGKNQLGTFYQPRGVFIDPLLLKSLPKSELVNGVGEMIKYGMIADEALFRSLAKVDMNSAVDLGRFVSRCCQIKAKVVSMDEREENLRAILNYGHTVGHAIEASSAYTLSHGQAVILGMRAEGWIALSFGILDRASFEAQEELLETIPVSLPDLQKNKLLKLALADKKSSSNTIRMSLPRRIGKMAKTPKGSYKISVESKLFADSIEYLRRSYSH